MNTFLVQQYLDHAAVIDDPSRTAVTDGQASLSYRELEVYSNRIANGLIACGVKRQDRVVFCMCRSIEVLVVVLGILKADAVYVPVDCKAPFSRWQEIIDDCSPAAIICDSQNAIKVMGLQSKGSAVTPVLKLYFEHAPGVARFGWESTDKYVDRRPNYKNNESDIAYILYTSGSTGRPKGVMVSHQNIRSYIEWAVDYFKIAKNDRILGTAPFHFDMSTFDIYCVLKAGCTLCVASEETTLFPGKFVDFVEQEGVTLWKGVSSLLMYLAIANVLGDKRMACLKKIVFAGESFPAKYLLKWMNTYPDKIFYNGYGPTEATGISLCYQVKQAPVSFQEKIPIGTPCDDTFVYLLAEDGSTVGDGEIGELCLAGKGVSRGYLNRPQETAAAFVEINADGTKERIYKTGDLAVLLPCGNYQFVGRKDRQLKFMGYRIEAGDIEHALMSLDEVSDAAVFLFESKLKDGVPGMIAFIETVHSSSELKELTRLNNHLPAYMIPKRFIQVEKMPRCSRGKIKYDELKTYIDS